VLVGVVGVVHLCDGGERTPGGSVGVSAEVYSCIGLEALDQVDVGAAHVGEGALVGPLLLNPAAPVGRLEADREGVVPDEAGDPQHHQPRVDLQETIGPQAPPLHHPGPEVLHQHVGLGGQLPQQLLPFGLVEVQRHRPLVPRDHLPPQPVGASRVPPGCST
jgi:hypothetical protein